MIALFSPHDLKLRWLRDWQEWLHFSGNTVFKQWQCKIITNIRDCVFFKLATKPKMKSGERLPR